MNIGIILNCLLVLTKKGRIKWDYNGVNLQVKHGVIRGFGAKFGKFEIQTLAEINSSKKRFWGSQERIVYAVSIKRGNQKSIFTTNPRIISGREAETVNLPRFFEKVQELSEKEEKAISDLKWRLDGLF